MGLLSSRAGGPRALVVLLVLAVLAGLGSVTGAAAPAGALQPTAPRAEQPGRGDDFPLLPAACADPRSTFPKSPCRVLTYGPERPTVVMWGDSHAWMYLPALRQVAKRRHVNLTVMFGGSCPAAIPKVRADGGYGSYCERHDAESLDYVRRLVRRGTDLKLVIGGFWSAYLEAYRETRGADAADSGYSDYIISMSELAHDGTRPLFRELGRLKVDVDVIGQAAVVPPDVRDCPAGREPYQCTMTRARAIPREAANRRWLTSMLRPLAGSPRYIDATSAYCNDRVCRPRVRGVNTYYDDIHLGATLTATMSRFFEPTFADLF